MARLTAKITSQGIVIESLWVLASQYHLTMCKQEKLAIPEPQKVRAMIDTGCTTSCVDKAVLGKLNLPVRGFVNLHTATTGANPIEAKLFDVSFWLKTHQLEPLVLASPVTEADLGSQTIDCLIGMDVLQKCVFHMDGPAETAFLDFN